MTKTLKKVLCPFGENEGQYVHKEGKGISYHPQGVLLLAGLEPDLVIVPDPTLDWLRVRLERLELLNIDIWRCFRLPIQYFTVVFREC